MNSFEGAEKAAAAHEAREAVGHPQRHRGRAADVEAALMRYLATEEYHERVEKSRGAGDGRPGPDESP